ncbi:hypothetical protein L2E82_47628 [Cichorium intybus]|uniref:Uncharacterized protein n=1 Tax=Cichorium intybus TaxID=13427 RepID=A0ACB8YWI9_CICIN|nr:hypothetical protein L2E82_47628 [Cichorium intybus]
MTSQTSSDVENPTHTSLIEADHGYVPLLDANLPSQSQESDQQPSKSVLLLISGLLAISLLVALIIGNIHIHKHDNDVKLPEKMDPVEQGVSDKSFRLPANVSSFSWTTDMLDWQAPAFHFYPGENWMNGPVYYKGWYHLFYQYSPEAAVWGPIVWGHAVSRDMVHWRHLPIAMERDQWYDVNGVWTGSTTILPNNKLVVLYTGSTNESVQVQNLAYPANPSDPLLVNWVKDPANPVLVPPSWINIKDFRDPTTAWLTPEGKWRMEGKWVPDNRKIDVGIGLRYDYGIYYASKTFYDQHKKRRILWSWIKETDSEKSDIKRGWASLMAVPRTVALDPKTGSNLIQWPIEEFDKIRSNLKEFNNVKLEPGSLVPLSVGPTSQLDIVVEIELDKKIANGLKVGGSVPYNCGGHHGAGVRDALGPFGLLILANNNLTEYTPTYFYIAKGSKGVLDTFFCIDQSKSSNAKDVDKSIYGSTVPVLHDEKLSMRILVDHSIVEGYAQGGRTCITSRIYPTEAINDDAQLFLFNNATNVTVTASLKIWQMGLKTKNESGWVWLGPSLIVLVVFGFIVWMWQNQRRNNRT